MNPRLPPRLPSLKKKYGGQAVILSKDLRQDTSVFFVKTKKDFIKKALAVFRIQSDVNPVYRKYIEQIGVNPEKVKNISQIPFLPIEFFKTKKVITVAQNPELRIQNLFLSSGTTSEDRSRHYVSDINLYEKSFRKCFEIFYGDIKQYAILALLPSYYGNQNSSLLYMVKDMIVRSKNKYSAFYNPQDENLIQTIKTLLQKKKPARHHSHTKAAGGKIILFGVSFALLNLTPHFPLQMERGRGRGRLFVIETGGMKGRREEITREELHKTLCEKFGVKKTHSEYGMTELLSQAYSNGDGIFKCPPWMKILVRDVNDPFSFLTYGKTGAINIIDLANIHSCSFIASQDVGKVYKDGSFEVLGRMDNSDLRGCNLLMA